MSLGPTSVSSFVAVGKLIANIASSLRDSGGSKSEYQEVLRELDTLQRALTYVTSLKKGEAAVLACQYPLTEFYSKIQKYEPSLGLGKADGKVKDLATKVSWGFRMKVEVEKLRGILSLHAGTINMLLNAYRLDMDESTAGQSSSDNASLREGLDSISGAISDEVIPQLAAIMAVVKASDVPHPDLRHTWFQEPVRFEDALGRINPVPAEISYSTLEVIIGDLFKASPGRYKVLSGEYEIFNTMNGVGNTCADCRVRIGRATKKLKLEREWGREPRGEEISSMSAEDRIEKLKKLENVCVLPPKLEVKPSAGDAVLVFFLGSYRYPDFARRAAEDMRNYEEQYMNGAHE
ncbi:MAG: hypothetical protein M1839_009546 [Geoglossum umbratile]|nr:MAG: hypothetical protein M1839_009546 [Geoglossum umbratile]